MIRVVYCVDSFEPAGTELNTVRWAERLDRTRFDLRVVCLSTRGPLLERYRELEIPVVPFVPGSFVKPPPLRTAWRMRRYLREERIDVFHAHGIYDNVFGVPVARWAAVPGIVASRRWWRTPVRASFGPLNRWSYRIADAVLANSRGVARIVREEDGIPARKIEVIENFVEEAAFQAPDPDWALEQRRALGIPATAPLLGVVARLRPEKDHRTIIDAFRRVAETHPAWHLVFAGDGPEEAALREYARSLGLGTRVHLAGRQPSRPSYHGLFDISLLASTSEGFPNSLLEAMAQGRPIVATRVGGVPDAVRDTENGFLVEPGDVQAFSERLGALMDDGSLRKRMGDRSRNLAGAFGETPTMAKLHHLYERLAGAD